MMDIERILDILSVFPEESVLRLQPFFLKRDETSAEGDDT